jgi:electron transfer flavoprotein beta subunit
MRIVVCVKQVYDPKTIRVSRSREELDLREAVKITNPADRYALEAALRLRQAAGGEVVALTVGEVGAEDTAHEAVAIGADRAVLITGPEPVVASGAAVTRIIAAAVERLAPVDLVLTGQIGLTDGTGSLAPRLAAALDWPVALDAVRLELADGGVTATVALPQSRVARSGDRPQPAAFRSGRSPTEPVVADRPQFLWLPLPAVVAVAPGPERPRYPHPARIANAWEPGLVEIWTAADPSTGLEQSLGLDAAALAADTEPAGLILGPERVRGQAIGGTPEEAAAMVVGLLKTRRVI